VVGEEFRTTERKLAVITDREALGQTVVEFDGAESSDRARRLGDVEAILRRGEDWGFIHTGGPEASWLLHEAKCSFVYGYFLASILSSHAACERRLAGRFAAHRRGRDTMRDEPSSDRGWKTSWGLGKLIQWARSAEEVSGPLADDLTTLNETRRHLAHFRDVIDGDETFAASVGAFSNEVEDLRGEIDKAALRSLDVAYELFFSLSDMRG
jgi:hypothetical protein